MAESRVCPAAALFLLLLLLTGCGSGVVSVKMDGSSADSGVPLGAGVGAVLGTATSSLPVATAPASLGAVLPTVMQAGSVSAVVTLSAAGVGANAVVLMDGKAHTATLISGSTVQVQLTDAELATGTRHSFAIQNPGRASSNAKDLLVTEGYWAFGDSITYGFGLSSPSTQNYANLLAAAYRLSIVNTAVSGSQACDMWSHAYRRDVGYSHTAAPLYSLMIGTNDVDGHGPGTYESLFSNCDLAVLTWLGTPRSSKVLPRDAAMVASGACTSIAAAGALGAALCLPQAGTGTFTVSLHTDGNPIYVWYLISDLAESADSLTVAVDGAPAGTYNTESSPAIATQNGSSTSVAVARIRASAGDHVVRIATVGTVGILGVGSNPSTGADRPRLLIGELPNQMLGNPYAPVANQLAYNADILAAEQLLLLDGFDARNAPTRSDMQGKVSEMTDQLHPNAVGEGHLAQAFDAALR